MTTKQASDETVNGKHEMKDSMDQEYDPKKLYRWDGREFIAIETNDVPKLPVTMEALEAVKDVRSAVSRIMATRPDLAIVASAMLLAAAKQGEIAQFVKEYGARIYSM
ncbi:hypothetical protein ELE36_03040 [Pseudolysobacter antarcticus]|uniref:Uncharacterized protein n=1 Tax=Pseudolysobacter antarcticus TaxID=2511995 RepID=A0A411HG49_9GAMM|nr:hypothetical protein [Pseudolysobacter antarcticus]QBB69431.1 hypothetical protein ELE36_03040 [Pseudolysobacter antarcticus]